MSAKTQFPFIAQQLQPGRHLCTLTWLSRKREYIRQQSSYKLSAICRKVNGHHLCPFIPPNDGCTQSQMETD